MMKLTFSSIYLGDSDVVALISKFPSLPSLTELSFQYGTLKPLSSEGQARLASSLIHLASLQTLKVSFDNSVTTSFFSEFVRSLTAASHSSSSSSSAFYHSLSCSSLNLDNCYHIDAAALAALVPLIPSLTSLAISRCRFDGEFALIPPAFAFMHSLQYLSLQNGNVSVAGCTALTAAFDYLPKLHIKFISDRFF